MLDDNVPLEMLDAFLLHSCLSDAAFNASAYTHIMYAGALYPAVWSLWNVLDVWPAQTCELFWSFMIILCESNSAKGLDDQCWSQISHAGIFHILLREIWSASIFRIFSVFQCTYSIKHTQNDSVYREVISGSRTLSWIIGVGQMSCYYCVGSKTLHLMYYLWWTGRLNGEEGKWLQKLLKLLKVSH